MHLVALLATAALSISPPQAAPDTLEAVERVRFLLIQRYRAMEGGWGARWSPRDYLGQPFDVVCDGERDDVCFADDPDLGRCPNLTQCHPHPRHLVEGLLESVDASPESAFVTGQAVYLLVKLDRVAEALQVAVKCRAETWFCAGLRAYALAGMGRLPEADAALRASLTAAPDSIACALTDATWVLGTWSQRGAPNSVPDAREDAEEWDCQRRRAVADTVWWLSDPLYTVPGNERLLVHFVRTLSARFHAEIREALPRSAGPREYRDNLWAERVRRGWLDSYDSRMRRTWTSRESARYHFVPDVRPEDLSAPTWRLEASLDDEGYTPSSGRFTALPWQVARFRGPADSTRLAAATRIAGSPVHGAVDAEAAFVLSEAPGRPPLSFRIDAEARTARALVTAPVRRWVAGVEVMTSRGVGWGRRLLEPLDARGPGLSDLLLYDPEGADPGDLSAAAAAMRGTTEVERDGEVGIFWETYDAPEGAVLHVDLAVERGSGGVVDRLLRLLSGDEGEGRGRLTWTEPATGRTHARAVALDLGDLSGGDYTLVLRVSWEGGSPPERRLAFRVE